MFELTYLNLSIDINSKHLWDGLGELMKATSDIFIDCLKLIFISSPISPMNTTYILYENNLTLF